MNCIMAVAVPGRDAHRDIGESHGQQLESGTGSPTITVPLILAAEAVILCSICKARLCCLFSGFNAMDTGGAHDPG